MTCAFDRHHLEIGKVPLLLLNTPQPSRVIHCGIGAPHVSETSERSTCVQRVWMSDWSIALPSFVAD